MNLRKLLVLNGPNLNMLGVREPDVYGRGTLESLEREVRAHAEAKGIAVAFFQSNSESELIGRIHAAQGSYDGIVYNPGAHTHYSYALRDAVGSIDVPVVEVHLSDIDEREPFRRISVIAPACVAQVKGLGVAGYCRAIDLLEEQGELARLGEGYESCLDTACAVVIAPPPTSSATPDSDADAKVDADAKAGADSDIRFGADASLSVDSDSRSGVDGAPGLSAGSAFAVKPDLGLGSSFSSNDAGAEEPGERARRLAAVRDACARQGLDALLVRDTSNIRWITDLDGVFDGERAHGLLVAEGRAELHTDSRYANAVRQAVAESGSDLQVSEERVSHERFAADALGRGEGAPFAGRLGIEDSIAYAEFAKMGELFPTGALVPTTDLVLGLRAVKSPAELMRLRTAQVVTDAAFAHIIDFMRPGMTEREVQLELEGFMLRHGGEGLAFSSIVATGENGADPHAIPGNARLEAGQCVVMDFGVRALGYCSDMTRTVFLGRPEGRMAAAWEVLRAANETVEALLAPGVTGAQAHAAAERVLEEGGFGGTMGHGLGHGVGLDVHELPVLNPRNDAPLVAGNVVTVEPGIYLPGAFGMRLEDLGVVTDGGFDVFTRSTHEMVIL